MNYFDWDSPYVDARGCYGVCEKHGKPVIVMEPVKGGALTNLPSSLEARFKEYNPEASMASWAIRWAASLDNVFMVLSGMSNMKQVEDNASFMSEFKPLNADEQALVQYAQDMLRSDMPYDPAEFVEAEMLCPKHIGIVRIMQMLNEHERMNNYTNTAVYYTNYLDGFGKAKDCDSCGECAKARHGEQIPALMKKADETISHF